MHVKTRIQILMKFYQNEKSRNEIEEAQSKFHHAVVEDSLRTYRPRIVSFDYD